MSGHDPNTLGEGQSRDELRERCLALVRRWQPLAQNGWDHLAAQKLGEEVEQIAETSERLNLDDVNLSALELAAYLCSFVDDHLQPNPRDLERLADMVNRLGFVLTDLSATATAAVHSLHGSRVASAPAPIETPAPATPPSDAFATDSAVEIFVQSTPGMPSSEVFAEPEPIAFSKIVGFDVSPVIDHSSM